MKYSLFWFFSLFAFLLVFCFNIGYAQNTEQYKAAIKSLKEQDTSSAKEYLLESIKENSDIPSYILLSDIYLKANSVSKRDAALDLLNRAIIKYPDSLNLKLKYASIISNSFHANAVDKYKNIIRKDSTCYEAWLRLGLLLSEEFSTYNKAYVISDAGYPLSTKDLTKSDFFETEKCFKRCIALDSENFEPYLNLSFVYEEADSLEKAIEILQIYIKNNSSRSKEIYLNLGHLNNKASHYKEAFNAFNNAMDIMDNKEKEDFTYNTIKFVFSDALTAAFGNLKGNDLKRVIDDYWNMQDPLRLTEYNERLLEHYSRVAYANVHFTRKESNIPGWKTNQGETILRYGEPTQYIRLRPQWSMLKIDNNPRYISDPRNYFKVPHGRVSSPNAEVPSSTTFSGAVKIPNDIFYYPDMRIGFADWGQNGNYVFNTPYTGGAGSSSQLSDNTEMLINTLRKNRPTIYDPKFQGPIFLVPYNLLQFRNNNIVSGLSDTYLSFGIEKSERSSNEVDQYQCGVFLYDNFFKPRFEYKDNLNLEGNDSFIITGKGKKILVNSVKMTTLPDSGYLCFEMIRNSDKGVSSYHGKAKIKKFNRDSLSVSDLVLAGKLETDGPKRNWLSRKQISLIPNPTHLFSKEQDLYVYYELYNLNLDPKGNCIFEQTLTITDKNYSKKNIFTKFFNSLGELIGLSDKDKKLSLVSSYNLKDRDQQMYLQLDLSQYEPGDYMITVMVKDKLTGKEAFSETELTWR